MQTLFFILIDLLDLAKDPIVAMRSLAVAHVMVYMKIDSSVAENV